MRKNRSDSHTITLNTSIDLNLLQPSTDFQNGLQSLTTQNEQTISQSVENSSYNAGISQILLHEPYYDHGIQLHTQNRNIAESFTSDNQTENVQNSAANRDILSKHDANNDSTVIQPQNNNNTHVTFFNLYLETYKSEMHKNDTR